jgi:Arc/MetJ-type ribon-helix-helix transcriptional regulator
MTKTISVRLDEPVLKALGSSKPPGPRSEAIRSALIDAAARGNALRSEAEALAADEGDRVGDHPGAPMDELSEPW